MSVIPAIPGTENQAQNLNLVTRGGNQCPVCHATTESVMDLLDFQLSACRACGCYASDALARGAATSFEPARYFGNAHRDQERWRDLLKRLTRGHGSGTHREPAAVLDVGCGNGAFLKFLGQHLALTTAVGIELDPERAREAQELNSDAAIHAGDALEALGRIPGSFDLITLWDVLEHVPAPAALIRALAARLAPGGCIFVQTINEHSLLPFIGRLSYRLTGGRLRDIARRTHEPHHLVFFTPRGLDILAASAGLRVSQSWWDRLDYARMDGNALVLVVTSALLWLENLLGNGLFINVILDRPPDTA